MSGPTVEHWLGTGFATLPIEQQLAAIERGINALWVRARGTLGDVTLGAIGERVLVHAQERFPFLSGALLDREGLRCSDVKAPSSQALDEAARYLLVELLTILGRLTAEILTPALHEELDGSLRPTSAHVRPRAAQESATAATSKPTKSSKPSKQSKRSKPAKSKTSSKSATPKSSRTRSNPSKNKKRSTPRGESS